MLEYVLPQVLTRDWGEELIVANTPHYLGKVLKMRAKTKGGLQKHVEKDETFYLFSGEAIVRTDWKGDIATYRMSAGQSCHVPPGSVHQVEAVTDCVFFEASTPHFNDRIRCEADYGLPEVGGLPTTR